MPKKQKAGIPRFLYHVTDVTSVDLILKTGLKGTVSPRHRDEVLKKPSIFTLIDPQDNLTTDIAVNQIWPNMDIESYAVIEINSEGIIGDVVFDDVMERSAHLHRVIKQELIDPRFLRLLKIHTINYPFHKIQEIMEQLMHKRQLTENERTIAEKWMPMLLKLQWTPETP